MKFTDHIDLEERNGQCALIVSDNELFDFLEDLFTDRDLGATVIQTPGSYQLLFPAAVSRATIHRILSEVGVAEVERIAGINSGASEV
jgi:hypothetical protein